MKIKYYSNACVRISSESGTNILCDPWVNAGAFLGSWFHWPPLQDNFYGELINEPCNGIYISHLHPDHYDPLFISKFVKQNPGIPIYIASFAHNWLKASLERIAQGFTKVIEIPTLQEIHINSNFSMKIFAADTCNPLICNVNIPCQNEPSLRGIDSVAVFCVDGKKVVNANDAMGVSILPKIAANIGQADLLMGHYGGASPYPQCFPEISDKKSEIRKITENSCKLLTAAAHSIQAKFIFPFAGQYVLGGRLTSLNYDRAVLPLDQAVNYIQTLTKCNVISVMPGGSFNLSNENKTKDYIEPSIEQMDSYFSKIKEFKFPYEKFYVNDWENPLNDLLNASNKVLQKSYSSKITLENSFVIGDGMHFVTINLDPTHENSSVEVLSQPKFKNITEISMPTSLLRNLTKRKKNYRGFTPMHWNQADIGSHFLWKREGIFDLNSHMLLNFFG